MATGIPWLVVEKLSPPTLSLLDFLPSMSVFSVFLIKTLVTGLGPTLI